MATMIMRVPRSWLEIYLGGHESSQSTCSFAECRRIIPVEMMTHAPVVCSVTLLCDNNDVTFFERQVPLLLEKMSDNNHTKMLVYFPE